MEGELCPIHGENSGLLQVTPGSLRRYLDRRAVRPAKLHMEMGLNKNSLHMIPKYPVRACFSNGHQDMHGGSALVSRFPHRFGYIRFSVIQGSVCLAHVHSGFHFTYLYYLNLHMSFSLLVSCLSFLASVSSLPLFIRKRMGCSC